MASEETGEPVSISLHDELRTWLEGAADDRDMDTGTYIAELLRAHRALEAGDLDAVDDVDELLGAEEIDDRIEDVRTEFVDLLKDVRDRVVQVKRETDAKAPADHGHADLESGLVEMAQHLEEVAEDVAEQRRELDELRADLEDGFENFEDVLEYLLETTDAFEERLDRLARATLGTRERVEELAGAVRKRDRTDQLKRDAALEGISAADCGSCGQSVPASLLTAPECPFCSAGFVDLEAKPGLFRSATFVTGDRPALRRAGTGDLADEIESDIDADRPDPGDVDWDTAGDDTP